MLFWIVNFPFNLKTGERSRFHRDVRHLEMYFANLLLLRLNPVSFLIPFLPALFGETHTVDFVVLIIMQMWKLFLSGLGAGLAWIATQQRPQNNTFSGIGSALLILISKCRIIYISQIPKDKRDR